MMKTTNTNLVVGLLLLLLSGSLLTACAQATTSAAVTSTTVVDSAKVKVLQPMRQIVDKLKKLRATGDPDFDYAFQVKIHTQGEQDLLKQELQNGTDSSLKQMAQQLLTVAQDDLNLIDGTLRQLSPSRPNQAFTQQQSRNVEAMALKLKPGSGGTEDKLTSNFDQNFMTVLLDHRQDAVDMAKTYLQYGRNNTLKTYAQDLVTKAQTQMETIKGMSKQSIK